MNNSFVYYDSPIGKFKITCTDKGLSGLEFDPEIVDHLPVFNPVLDKTRSQLDQYFDHQLKDFDLTMDLSGTYFQKKVWDEVYKIKYGITTSYLEIAKAIGDHKAVRAVGLANGKNPIPIIIPCHRIIGSNRKLTGYGGGLWRKEWLLKHEGALLI